MSRSRRAGLAALIACVALGAAPPVAPWLKVTTTAGRQLAIDRRAHQVVVLQFWATWCAPCLAEMPEIETAHRRLAGKPVQFIGIALDAGASRSRVAAGGRRVSYPLARLEDSNVKPGNIPTSIPETLIYDRRGKLRYVFRGGEAPLSAARLEQVVRRLLGER